MIMGKRVLGWIVALALAASCAPVHATSDIPEEEAAETVTAQMVLGGEGGEPAAEEPETEETPEAAIAEEPAEAPEEALEDATLEPETPAEEPMDAEAAEPALNETAEPEAAQAPAEPPAKVTTPEPEGDEHREMLRLTIAYAATGGRADEAGAPAFTVKADGEILARFNLKDGEQTTVEVPYEAEAPLETADEPESEATEEPAADEPETETVTASAIMASAAEGATVTVTIDAESSVTDWTLDGEAIGTEGSRVTFLLTNGATLAATTDYPEIAMTGARTAPMQPFVLLLLAGLTLPCGAMLRKRMWEGGEADA